MLYLTKIRAVIVGMLLAMGFVTPSFANSQTLVSPENDRPKSLETDRVKKPGFVFRASEIYLAGGTAFDMTTTVMGLSHPTTASRSDGTFLTHYYAVESGWAGYLGRTDSFTAVGANVILNVAVDRFSRRLYARGGRWRALAIGTNVLKATLNTIAAGNNVRRSERIDSQVRIATGYQGQILWSR